MADNDFGEIVVKDGKDHINWSVIIKNEREGVKDK